MVTLSPDGERIVFVAENSASVTYLATKRLDQRVATPLPGTEGAYAPFFSPDGQWIGFFAEGQLKKTRLDGGAPIVLTRAPAGRGASWGDDGEIIAALDTQVGLSRVSSATGAVTPVTTLGAGELSHRWPQVLPGATAAVFTIGRALGNYAAADIAAVPLGAAPGAVRIVREGAGHTPHYLPTGHLAYVADGLLHALPFDADRLETRGTPTVVLGEISTALNFGSSQLSFSRTGAVVYRGGPTRGKPAYSGSRTTAKRRRYGTMRLLSVSACIAGRRAARSDGRRGGERGPLGIRCRAQDRGSAHESVGPTTSPYGTRTADTSCSKGATPCTRSEATGSVRSSCWSERTP